jgi:thiamine monophosphate synthase
VTGLDPFYPIVDSADWVARLVGAGARLVQLRVKEKDGATVARETRASLALCGKAGDPVSMARAFGQAIEAGRAAFLAGPMQPRDMAAPSTPVVGKANLS